MDKENISYRIGSAKLGRIYERWREENGFKNEYMDDLLSSERLNSNQREWLENLDRAYLLALRREKRIKFLTSPGVVVLTIIIAVMTIIYLSIPKYASDECRDLIADNSFGMIILGAFIGYFAHAFQSRAN